MTENTLKEMKGEAGLDVELERAIVIQNRKKHNRPVSAHKTCKIFSLCHVKGGRLIGSLETITGGYFACDDLLEPAESKMTKEQIAMCFIAYYDEDWKTLIG